MNAPPSLALVSSPPGMQRAMLATMTREGEVCY